MKIKIYKSLSKLLILLGCFLLAVSHCFADDSVPGAYSSASSTVSVTIPDRIAVRVDDRYHRQSGGGRQAFLEIQSNFGGLIRIPVSGAQERVGDSYRIMTIEQAQSVTIVVLPR